MIKHYIWLSNVQYLKNYWKKLKCFEAACQSMSPSDCSSENLYTLYFYKLKIFWSDSSKTKIKCKFHFKVQNQWDANTLLTILTPRIHKLRHVNVPEICYQITLSTAFSFSVPKQWNGSHVGVPRKSSESWTLFASKCFLLLQ